MQSWHMVCAKYGNFVIIFIFIYHTGLKPSSLEDWDSDHVAA